jgi:signal transduction histidine kinase
MGYFQNNPDGSFQTPLVESGEPVPSDRVALFSDLKDANEIFNQKRVAAPDRAAYQPERRIARKETEQTKGFAEKYLDLSRSRRTKGHLGQKEKRLEEISVGQALHMAQQEQVAAPSGPESTWTDTDRENRSTVAKEGLAGLFGRGRRSAARQPMEEAQNDVLSLAAPQAQFADSFQVEVAPLQSVFIDDDRIFVFRRIMINKQIYRQGFVLRLTAFLDHLARTYFLTQPMAQYSQLRLAVMDQGNTRRWVEAGVSTKVPSFVLHRDFPSPFRFLNATLTCEQIPRSAGRRTLNIMVVVLAAIVLLGLLAIYQSTRTIVELSERRSQFVSSVTHELKTPLTNIRMYIEMLEQGIARDQEREQEYFRILDSEGARLSRLINNVLELSKLERRQRKVNLKTGTFEDVIRGVKAVMQEKLRKEGFSLKVHKETIRPFKYDREMMIQVLINLIENSVKFGKSAPLRQISIRVFQEADKVKVLVGDTGPGIPRRALRRIFDDFYRVDNSLTQTTRGTGIGLALVRRFIKLMGGTVSAANNEGPGCTISISLPC